MENEQDFDAIIRLAALLKVNMPVHEAVLHSINENEPAPTLAPHERAILWLQLLRNKAHLLRQGFRALPLVQVNGWPGERPSAPVSPALSQEQGTPRIHPMHHAEESSANLPLPDFLANPDALEQCTGDRAEPCDQEPASR
jgi:hypothetical protein